MTNPEFEDTLRRVLRDVTVTLGAVYARAVKEIAESIRQLDIEDASDRYVKDVQQYVHDTFVDTTWPACPLHGRHPLEYRDGAWLCPEDGVTISKLGELPSEVE